MNERYGATSQFNSWQYESRLSLFGRKVLNTMIKKWTTDKHNQNCNSSYQPRMRSEGSKRQKVLTFLSEEPQPPQLLQLPPLTLIEMSTNNNRVDDDVPFDFNENPQVVPPVPTANDLLQIIETKKEMKKGQNELMAVKNMKVAENGAKTSIHENFIRLEDVGDKYDTTGAGKDRSVPVSRVNWDDMFDCDLLSEVATNRVNTKSKIQKNTPLIVSACNLLEKVSPDTSKENKGKEKNITEEIKTNEAKKVKRKSQAKVTDAISKKVKKINEPEKRNFRKQKYTKTVKNWLDDIDPNNPVIESKTTDTIKDDDISNKTNFIKPKKNKTPNIGITTLLVEKAKSKANNKKVVQAQLANKDGIMKFDKPKDKLDPDESSSKKENNKTDKAKEKKAKAKFIAPIKSQVPVMEVNYKVISIDENNINDHKSRLCRIENSDIIIVLVYSNGFSQLNCHYTEDSCVPEGFMVYIEECFYFFNKGTQQSFREVIAAILENNNVLCYEGKSVLVYLKSMFDLDFTNLIMIDAKIGGSLLDTDNPPENFSDLQKLLSYTPEYTIATECTLQKTAWYVTLLDKCGVRLTTMLKENGLWSVFVNIEMKLTPIIAEMEYRGVTVDMQKLRSMEDVLLSKMKEVEQECYKAAGKSFQINSAVQIRSIIYDELQLDTKSNVKIRETICQGAKSTSETMLRSLVSVHPLPKLILEYRHLHKAHATFLTGIAQHVKDGVVRPTWVQTAAATGRIASNNPNLQAIPKAPFSLILFPDENSSGNQTLSIRSVYTARGGWSLLAADFQHVEVRVFAHCAADAALVDALQAGGDLFRTLAATWLKKPAGEISSEDRERTKRIVYASLYGAGCRKLMDILGVSYDQALSVIASFNRTFPSVKSFGRSVVARCAQAGGRLATLCGRGRQFRHIGSADPQLRAQAERQAVNFVIQGSAADLCKLAMARARARLRARRPAPAHLLLQIHDELVWEVRDGDVPAAAVIIKEVMEGCGQQCGMSIPLPVAISVGKTWGAMAEYCVPATIANYPT